MRRHILLPIVFVAVALLGALAVALATPSTTAFRLSTSTDLVQLPEIVIPHLGLQALAGALVTVSVANLIIRARERIAPRWLGATYWVLLVLVLLCWGGAGQAIPVPGLLFGAIALSIPIVFGALGGVISERVGVVNIAIEGQLLAGAFTGAIVASITQQPIAGLVAAMLAGAGVSALLGVFALRYRVDQVIVGVVLNVLVVGLTSFAFSTILTRNTALNTPATFDRYPIPVLSEIPVIGPVLFRQSFIGYLMFITVLAVAVLMYRTRWGLRMRAVGEHPAAAATVGIHVNRTRTLNLLLAGVIAGAGGAYFSLAAVGSFGKEMSAGAGFIALAAVIFGGWDPIRVALVALLFGFTTSLQSTLGIVGSAIPSEFLLMLPYVVTLFAVATASSRVRGPAALGQNL